MKFKIFLITIFAFAFASPAFAFKADALKGLYEIISQSSPQTNKDKSYLLVDTNTLLIIWQKYASGDLPSDLVPYKDHGAIIAGFTNRNFTILVLEENATVGGGYMHISGDNTELELARQPNGQFQAGVVENQNLSRYLLAAPQPLPNP